MVMRVIRFFPIVVKFTTKQYVRAWDVLGLTALGTIAIRPTTAKFAIFDDDDDDDDDGDGDDDEK